MGINPFWGGPNVCRRTCVCKYCIPRCSTLITPSSVSLTLADIANVFYSQCDCTQLNDTYILTYAGMGWGGPVAVPQWGCLWVHSGTYPCSSSATGTITLRLCLYPGGDSKLIFYLNFTYTTPNQTHYNEYAWYNSVIANIDCTAQRTLTLQGAPFADCVLPTTCQLN